MNFSDTALSTTVGTIFNQSTTHTFSTMNESEATVNFTYKFLSTIAAPKELVFTWDKYLGMVLSLIILFTGMPGNILTMIIMRRKPFRASSACVYLPCMALFDSIFLITGIPYEWIDWFSIDIDPWACRFHRFFFYTSGDISIWILVAFTFDRFIAVCFPFKKKFFCQPKKATITSVVCILLGVLKNAHVFWTRGIETSKGHFIRSCGQVEEYRKFEKFVRPWIAFAFVSVIPFVTIIIFNASIVHHLLKSKKSRPASFSGRQSQSTVISNKASISCGRETTNNDTSTTSTSTAARGSKALYQTTAMCLSVSFAFLIFICPSVIIHIGKPYWKKLPWYDGLKTINNMFVYVNHSINFYLYCLTGVRFRSELQVVLGKKQQTYSIYNGLSPRYSTNNKPSVLMSDIKDSTVSTELKENRGFAEAAIALALAKTST